MYQEVLLLLLKYTDKYNLSRKVIIMIRMPYIWRKPRFAKQGFLILELVVALGAFSFFCIVVGWVHVTTIMRQKDALNYLQAVTEINHTFELLQQKKVAPLKPSNDIAIDIQYMGNLIKAHEGVIITASFNDAHNTRRSIAIEGAILKDMHEA